MKREKIPFHRDWYELFKGTPKSCRLELITAILDYAFEEKNEEINPKILSVFSVIKQSIKSSNIRYRNGCKGGNQKVRLGLSPNLSPNLSPKLSPDQIGNLSPGLNEEKASTEEDVVKENFPHTPIKENIIYSNQEKNNKKKPLSKDRVKEKEKEEKVPPAGGSKKDKPSLPTQSEKIDYNGVKEYFNFTFKDKLPQITVMTDGRKTAVKARIAEHGKEAIRTVFRNVLQSPWLLGSNERNWRADFDWLFKASNFVKVLEGKYIGYGKTNSTKAERERGVDELAELARRVLAGNKS